MELTVKNFRGIERAAIKIDPVALVAGPNAAGKSSIALAMAACLRQTPMPIDGVAKNQCGLLLKRDAKRGSASLSFEHGNVQVNWPGGSCSVDGEFPTASDYAAGIVSVAGLKPKDAATALRQYIGADPSRDDLREALPTAEVSDALVDSIWQEIEANGWDAAHRRARDSGIKAKGRWEQITGADYGAKKALSWLSPLVPSDDGRTIQEVEAALAEAQAALESLIGQQALSDDERQRLEEIAGSAAPQLEAIQIALEAAEEVLEEARQHHAGLQRPVTLKDPLSCPHCGGEVEICAGQVVKFSAEVDHDENVRRAAAISEALAAKQVAEEACLALRQQLVQAEAAHRRILDAAARLEQFAGRSASEAEIQSAREAVRFQQDVLMGLQATEQAERVAAGITVNAMIVEALAPDGVRKTVLARAMSDFNTWLDDMAGHADWPAVEITEDMQVTYGRAPYALLSASEQFRARVILQLVMAHVDGSSAVVIDAADILDRDGRNQLLKVVRKAGIPALITMTMNAEADVPDLARAGIGRSYWIDDAIADPIG